MPTGLQCWDANGNLTVDLTSRMTRLLGSVNQSTGGSRQEPALAQGIPFVLPVLDQNGLMYPEDIRVPTISGITITWLATANFFYGTY
ncbi:hypothetical protein [Stenotrophomonas sp. VV52]|uniref:hypothetical protein n=1 Tax=Stenotrophomonas sp. VV52 TaxID=2066958 RepID=UPI000C9DDFAC|nr:hypothetical protein [Stenotrophomonas sp. VV52]